MCVRSCGVTGVRFEQPADAAAVREVNELAFGSPVEGRIVERLRGAPDSLSLVATRNDVVIGHILFTAVGLEPPAGFRVAGLGPMSVRPEDQRSGVGSRLIRAGLEACREHGYSAVVVVGHPDYYPRFGFEPAHTRGLTLRDFDVPQNVFMVVELDATVRDRLKGAIRYRSEFAEAT
jgi:putative acetyltransferase